MGQGRFGHDRILSGVIVCHVVGNNGVFPERGSRGPCVGFWGPGSIWQRMWYFCAKFLWIKGVFYHGLCVIIYAGRIVPCLHWYLIRVIGRMTSLEWFSIWETSNNIINFNDVRKRLWKLIVKYTWPQRYRHINHNDTFHAGTRSGVKCIVVIIVTVSLKLSLN